MKRRVFAALLAAAALCAQPAAVPGNSREWKRAQAHAQTPEQFDALSRWCRSQAELSRQQQAHCESELRDSYAHPPAHPFPKNPPREQVLRTLAGGYQRQAAEWDRLAEVYSSKARISAASPHL